MQQEDLYAQGVKQYEGGNRDAALALFRRHVEASPADPKGHVAVGVILWSIFQFNPDFIPAVTGALKKLRPFCNSAFYFCFFTIMTLIYIGVIISVQFD